MYRKLFLMSSMVNSEHKGRKKRDGVETEQKDKLFRANIIPRITLVTVEAILMATYFFQVVHTFHFL